MKTRFDRKEIWTPLDLLLTSSSCDFALLSLPDIQDLQAKGMSVIPWNVNDSKDIKRMMEWRVDGVISDYLNRVKELFK